MAPPGHHPSETDPGGLGAWQELRPASSTSARPLKCPPLITLHVPCVVVTSILKNSSLCSSVKPYPRGRCFLPSQDPSRSRSGPGAAEGEVGLGVCFSAVSVPLRLGVFILRLSEPQRSTLTRLFLSRWMEVTLFYCPHVLFQVSELFFYVNIENLSFVQ